MVSIWDQKAFIIQTFGMQGQSLETVTEVPQKIAINRYHQ